MIFRIGRLAQNQSLPFQRTERTQNGASAKLKAEADLTRKTAEAKGTHLIARG
ncbi:hypothetical protein D3C71_2218250 [compost metagenome]